MTRQVAKTITKEEADKREKDLEDKQKIESAIKHIEEVEDITSKNYKYRDSKGVGDTIAKVFSKFGVTEEAIEKTQGKTGCGCDKAREFLNTIFPYGKKEAPQSEAEETNGK